MNVPAAQADRRAAQRNAAANSAADKARQRDCAWQNHGHARSPPAQRASLAQQKFADLRIVLGPAFAYYGRHRFSAGRH
jgi:hypothetical protein